MYIVYACTCTVFALVFLCGGPRKIPPCREVSFFPLYCCMQNLLDMKKLGSQGGLG